MANSHTKFEKILNAGTYSFMVGHRQTTTENAKFEAILSLRFAESGTKSRDKLRGVGIVIATKG